MTRPALSSEEREILTGARSAGSSPQSPWILRDRRISGEELGAIELQDMVLEDVDLETMTWSSPVFRRCVFRRVRFAGSIMQGARFEQVRFEDCRHEEMSWIEAIYDSCHWSGGGAIESRWLRCRFDQSPIEGLNASGLTLEETQLSNCRLDGCQLSEIRFEECTLSSTTWSGGSAGEITFNYTDLNDITFSANALDGLEFIGGTTGVLVFEQIAQGTDVLLSDVTLTELKLSHCTGLDFFRVADSRIDRIDIQACAPFEGLTLHSCQLATLTVTNSKLIEPRLVKMQSSGPSSIEHSSLEDWTFEGGSWTDLSVTDVAVQSGFEATDTRFIRLQLANLTQTDDLYLATNAVSYEDSPQTWDDLLTGQEQDGD